MNKFLSIHNHLRSRILIQSPVDESQRRNCMLIKYLSKYQNKQNIRQGNQIVIACHKRRKPVGLPVPYCSHPLTSTCSYANIFPNSAARGKAKLMICFILHKLFQARVDAQIYLNTTNDFYKVWIGQAKQIPLRFR